MVYTPYCEMRMDETSCFFLSFRLHFPLKEESITALQFWQIIVQSFRMMYCSSWKVNNYVFHNCSLLGMFTFSFSGVCSLFHINVHIQSDCSSYKVTAEDDLLWKAISKSQEEFLFCFYLALGGIRWRNQPKRLSFEQLFIKKGCGRTFIEGVN